MAFINCLTVISSAIYNCGACLIRYWFVRSSLQTKIQDNFRKEKYLNICKFFPQVIFHSYSKRRQAWWIMNVSKSFYIIVLLGYHINSCYKYRQLCSKTWSKTISTSVIPSMLREGSLWIFSPESNSIITNVKHHKIILHPWSFILHFWTFQFVSLYSKAFKRIVTVSQLRVSIAMILRIVELHVPSLQCKLM